MSYVGPASMQAAYVGGLPVVKLMRGTQLIWERGTGGTEPEPDIVAPADTQAEYVPVFAPRNVQAQELLS